MPGYSQYSKAHCAHQKRWEAAGSQTDIPCNTSIMHGHRHGQGVLRALCRERVAHVKVWMANAVLQVPRRQSGSLQALVQALEGVGMCAGEARRVVPQLDFGGLAKG